MSHLSEPKRDFSQQLHSHITESGYSISQVARLSDVSKRTLANWVSGYVQKPRHADDLLRICQTLQLNPQQTKNLFTLTGLPVPDSLVSYKPFHIGPALPYFVGRDSEIEQLTSDVLNDNLNFAYAVVGMAGVGKTTFALQVAHALHQHFSDGVLWAQMDSAATLETTVTSFALSFGVDLSTLPDVQSKSRAWRSLLHHKRSIIILDNVTQFTNIEALLPARGDNLVLITTQQKDFGMLKGVKHIVLSPFTTEAWDIMRYFLPEERINSEKVALQKLIEQLGGLPLALSIAMSRLAIEPHWTIQHFSEELASIQSISSENVSVYRTFQMTYQRLPELSKMVFSVLGLFNREAIPLAAVAYILDMPLSDTRAELDNLYRASLVQYSAEHSYRLHPLLAQFAHSINPADNLKMRFINYYTQYGTDHYYDYPALRQQLEHIFAMIDLALSLGELDALVTTISYFFAYLENMDLLKRIEAQMDALYRLAQSTEDTVAQAKVTYYYGRLQRRLGHWQEGEILTRKALELATETQTIRVILLCHNSLGIHAQNDNQLDKALSHFKAAKNLINKHELYGYRYSNLLNTANLYYQMERYDEAWETAQEVLSYITDIDSEAEDIQIMVVYAYATLRDIAKSTNKQQACQHYQTLGIQLAHKLNNQKLIDEFSIK